MTTRQLHQEALVIDSHNDSIVTHIRANNLGFNQENTPERVERNGTVAHLRGARGPLAQQPVQLDIPKMRAGGIDAAFFAVDVTSAWNNYLLYAMDALGFFAREVDEHPEDLVVARRAEDITRAKEEGRLAAILAIENSNALEQSQHVLHAFYEAGVRTMTLTHSTRTWAGDGCEVENGGGLTGFGRTVVQRMNQLGMLVDVSHLNDPGFWNTLDHSQAPVLASHSCCRALCQHPRNLTDEQLKALAAQGGVVALTFVPEFLHPDAPDLESLLDHIDHAVQQAGIDHVALGSDFDGGGDLLEDATAYPSITAGLEARNYPRDDIRKILGENHLQLLRETIG